MQGCTLSLTPVFIVYTLYSTALCKAGGDQRREKAPSHLAAHYVQCHAHCDDGPEPANRGGRDHRGIPQTPFRQRSPCVIWCLASSSIALGVGSSLTWNPQ